eukprot:s928_g4.t1
MQKDPVFGVFAVFIKNTFIEMVPVVVEGPEIRRSRSEPELTPSRLEPSENEIEPDPVNQLFQIWQAHLANTCKPCIFINRKGDGCRKGNLCSHCQAPQPPSLLSLSVGAAKIGELVAHSSLAPREVHLSYNCIGDRGAVDLLQAIAKSSRYPCTNERSGDQRLPLWMRLEYNYINWHRINKQLDEVKWMSAESRESQAAKDSKAAICLHYSFRNQNPLSPGMDLGYGGAWWEKGQGRSRGGWEQGRDGWQHGERDRDHRGNQKGGAMHDASPAWARDQEGPAGLSLAEISAASFAHHRARDAVVPPPPRPELAAVHRAPFLFLRLVIMARMLSKVLLSAFLATAAAETLDTPLAVDDQCDAAGGDCALQALQTRAASVADAPGGCPGGLGRPIGGAPCRPCPEGTYSEEGAASCTRCKAGTWNDRRGSPTKESCMSCPAGTWSSQEGALSLNACVECPAGRWSNSSGLDSLAKCTACQPGTWSGMAGATAAGVCTECEAGRWSPQIAAVTETVCVACTAGRYNEKAGSSDFDACISCKPGTWSGKIGADTVGVCEACPAGKWSPAKGATFPETCASCQPGTYSSTKGASSQEFCEKCGPGKYSEDGMSK